MGGGKTVVDRLLGVNASKSDPISESQKQTNSNQYQETFDKQHSDSPLNDIDNYTTKIEEKQKDVAKLSEELNKDIKTT